MIFLSMVSKLYELNVECLVPLLLLIVLLWNTSRTGQLLLVSPPTISDETVLIVSRRQNFSNCPWCCWSRFAYALWSAFAVVFFGYIACSRRYVHYWHLYYLRECTLVIGEGVRFITCCVTFYFLLCITAMY